MKQSFYRRGTALLYDLANFGCRNTKRCRSAGIPVVSVCDDPMPVNREAIVQELMPFFACPGVT